MIEERENFLVAGTIDEINTRFRENSVGWQFENGQLVRIADEVTHDQIVRPALALLAQPGFKNANKELLTAFKHIRDGHAKAAITAAGSAFEATLKAICTKRGWAFQDGKDTAKRLIDICRSNGLFADWQDQQLHALTEMLVHSAPATRNKAGAHGAAPDTPDPDIDLVMLAIHQAAASILFVMQRDKALG